MAQARSIPPAAMESIARQIGERLSPPGMTAAARGVSLQVAESFPVYMLGLDAIMAKPGKLLGVVSATGVWQHQIRHGADAREIARSIEPGAGVDEWRVQEVIASPSAQRIDEAITWIDSHVAGEAIASLLVVPSYFVTAFWLQEPGKDEVVIADMPAKLGNLRPLFLYSGAEFLDELAKAKPVTGIPEPGSAPRFA